MKRASFVIFAVSLLAVPVLAETKPELTKEAIIGKYLKTDLNECDDGERGLCDEALILEEKGKLLLVLGDSSRPVTMSLRKSKNVYVFDENFLEDCDEPGCGNLESAEGVVYYRKVNKKWIPTIRVSINVDFPFPEYPGDTEGPVTSTAHLIKQ